MRPSREAAAVLGELEAVSVAAAGVVWGVAAGERGDGTGIGEVVVAAAGVAGVAEALTGGGGGVALFFVEEEGLSISAGSTFRFRDDSASRASFGAGTAKAVRSAGGGGGVRVSPPAKAASGALTGFTTMEKSPSGEVELCAVTLYATPALVAAAVGAVASGGRSCSNVGGSLRILLFLSSASYDATVSEVGPVGRLSSLTGRFTTSGEPPKLSDELFAEVFGT